MPTIYSPTNWQVIKVTPKDVTQVPHYRILAGWNGSYTYGSSWKLSSGIEAIIDLTYNVTVPKESKPYWKVPQTSGSVYILNKHQEHMSTATMGVLKDESERFGLFESVQSSNPDIVLEVVEMMSILEEF